MVGFQRARSAEQRETRRRAILDTAAAMLTEMPVAEVSLNELSRRVGLAKSNVLRYFDSREAVLLELLDDATQDWLAALAAELSSVDTEAPLADRCAAVAVVVAQTLADRPVLNDLVGAQVAVLERNVSPTVAARFKRAGTEHLNHAARLVLDLVPELGPQSAQHFAGAVALIAGALWAHGQPSPALEAAYAADPELAALRLDTRSALTELVEVLLRGWIAVTTPP